MSTNGTSVLVTADGWTVVVGDRFRAAGADEADGALLEVEHPATVAPVASAVTTTSAHPTARLVPKPRRRIRPVSRRRRGYTGAAWRTYSACTDAPVGWEAELSPTANR